MMNSYHISIPTDQELTEQLLTTAEKQLNFTEQNYQTLAEQLTEKLSTLTNPNIPVIELSVTELYCNIVDPEFTKTAPTHPYDKQLHYAHYYKVHCSKVAALNAIVMNILQRHGLHAVIHTVYGNRKDLFYCQIPIDIVIYIQLSTMPSTQSLRSIKRNL